MSDLPVCSACCVYVHVLQVRARVCTCVCVCVCLSIAHVLKNVLFYNVTGCSTGTDVISTCACVPSSALCVAADFFQFLGVLACDLRHVPRKVVLKRAEGKLRTATATEVGTDMCY